MSLTAHIRSRRGPVFEFLAAELPRTQRLSTRVNKALRGAGAADPANGTIALGAATSACPTPAPSHGAASLNGNAIGYALAAHFGASVDGESPAEQGSAKLDRRLARVRRRRLRTRLPIYTRAGRLLEEAHGRLAALDRDAPGYWREVAVAAAVLGRLEQYYRAPAGQVDEHVLRPLVAARGDLDRVAPMLVSESAVSDLAALAGQAAGDLAWLLDRPTLRFAPVFAQSAALGGADGDFTVDGTLVELKSTTPQRIFSGRDLHQVAGYLLADTDDRHRLRHVALVAPRWRRHVVLDVDDLLASMTPASAPARSLTDWRERFAAAAAQAASLAPAPGLHPVP